MQQTSEKPARKVSWGVPASVAAHVLVIALLIFGLPLPQVEPEQPEAIAVELVPPPEPAPQEEEQPTQEAAEEQPPEEEAPEEQPAEAAEAEAPPQEAASEPQQSAPPIQVLRPVFQFGEQDAGPREATDGSAPEEAETEEPAPDPAPEPIDEAAAPLPAEKPPVELAEARTLFSRAVTDDPAAMTAMAGLPREMRGSELCTTELREQLRNSTPPYWPDLLPAYRLGAGSVLEVREAAFRARGQWYDLSFRCEVDADATRVLSFAFNVGDAIPRDQWRARGFPGG
ncbi:DUF930 domain-containing protein [Oricola sp.]|uniref:DUF930 domain-containing protein n=1 Tax=Oricola sp. TaxID=1979950 RepID=UPI0035167771